MKRISSRHNPLVARYRRIARGDEEGAVLLDGPHLMAEALAASARIEHAVVSTGGLQRAELRDLVGQLTAKGVDVVTVSPSIMDAISPVRSPSAIVGIAQQPRLPATPWHTQEAPLVIVVVDIQDPGNVGAIVRVAEAAGATAVVMAGNSADPFSWKAMRGSMGSALRLPVFAGTAVDAIVAGASEHGCRVVATTPRGGTPLFDADLVGPLAVLIGGEGAGLAPALVDAADERVTIPMQAPVESLNAAVTAALVLYEARRQRTAALAHCRR